MKIIGHRGAAGLALENTLESLKAGIASGVDALEFDVRLTKDKFVVLCHDPSLARVSGNNQMLSELNLGELNKIKLNNGETVPTLSEAMKVAGGTPVIIEIKDEHMARQVLKIVSDFPDADVTIVSFRHHEIALIEELEPKVRTYIGSRTNSLEIYYIARAIEADGLDINFWILNPVIYFKARRSKLDIMVYTIDNKFLARFIHFLYPRAMICTNRPDYFVRRRKAN